jgi:peptidoglycan/LPS O-acetylase OafA/YrhL
MSGSPLVGASLRIGARLAFAAIVLAWLLAGSTSPATAESPSPSAGTDYGGDTRTTGAGPGLVGSPLYAIGGVLAVAAISIGITLIYLRATSGSTAPTDESEPR